MLASMLRYGCESLPNVDVLRVGPYDAVLPAHSHRLGLHVNMNFDVPLGRTRDIRVGLPLMLAKNTTSNTA